MKPEHADDCDLWLQALRGKPVAKAPESTLKEANLLRHLVHNHVALLMPVVSEHEVQRFLFQLRRERISARRWFLPQWSMAAMLVLALGLTLTTPLWLGEIIDPDRDPSPSYRGESEEQHLHSYTPEMLANKISKLLQKYDLQVRRVYENNAIRLQAVVPADAIQLRNDLQLLGLKVPAHGRLDVLITTKQTP